MQGVPAQGVVDSGGDITIIEGDLFKRVAAVAKLKNLKKPDKVPRTYDHRPFTLDGLMISFRGTTMKMDAPESLLLSEGVCRQLGIPTYHTSILARQDTHHSHQLGAPRSRLASRLKPDNQAPKQERRNAATVRVTQCPGRR